MKQMKDGHAVVGDLSDAGDLGRVISEAIEKMGGLDILVNNGGASNDAMAGNNEEAYLAAMKLHVTGVLHVPDACRTFLPTVLSTGRCAVTTICA